MATEQMNPNVSGKPTETVSEVTILFAGDSGDGMQLTGTQFTLASAFAKNDLATLPDFPAEIRAPVGTTYGVSGYQLQFGSSDIFTAGDEVDLLVAMNPAALKVNLNRVKKGGTIIVNTNSFGARDLKLAKYDENPLENDTLAGFKVVRVGLNDLTGEALKDFGMSTKDIDRSKNMFALGLALWLYSRPVKPAQDWISAKFAKKDLIRDANLEVLKKGYHYGETIEDFIVRYEVPPAELKSGKYRTITGNQALGLGFVAATQLCGLETFYGSYPITPASDLLHILSKHKNFGIRTFQAEDEIAAVAATIGASFGGLLAITGTSGPGIALKGEAMGLAMMMELPMVIVNVQRGGPSTGLPTKTEQSDLLQALYGRSGEAPMAVIASKSPGDCFFAAIEASRIALEYMMPVMLLSDGYLGNGSEPWLIPDVDKLEKIEVKFATKHNHKTAGGEDVFLPYKRDEKLARPWATPGTKGLEHRLGGLEKEENTGNVNYEPENHERMIEVRAERIERIADSLPATEIIGPDSGKVLVIGWGGTAGSIESAVRKAHAAGKDVSYVHLRYINPLPKDLGDIISRFDKFLVPELNKGQLIKVLRDRYLIDAKGLNKVQGQPFRTSEIFDGIVSMLDA